VLFSAEFLRKKVESEKYLAEYDSPACEVEVCSMAINDLTSAIIEKRETVQRLKAEIQQIEKDLETLTAAARILERGSGGNHHEAPPAPGPASVRATAPESIKKAFP
jgi:chromosome segregation ATPase